MIIYACNIFILKPMPTKAKLKRRYLNLPFSAALSKNKEAKSKVKTSKLSIVLFLLSATKTGVTARDKAAMSPAVPPKLFFTYNIYQGY